MALYTDLASRYDELFPPNPASLEVARSVLRPGLPVLDLGCATASLLIELAKEGVAATGVEPSEAMRRAALEAIARSGVAPARAPRIVGGSMVDAAAFADPASLGLILCLGNTLPHLASAAEAEAFFATAHSLLAPGGSLILQTLNYDRVLGLLAQGPFAFPDLEVPGLRFRRRYEARPQSEGLEPALDFVTEVATPGGTDLDRLVLRPFRPAFLLDGLKKAGFSDLEAWSTWAREPFDACRDPYLILRAGKTS